MSKVARQTSAEASNASLDGDDGYAAKDGQLSAHQAAVFEQYMAACADVKLLDDGSEDEAGTRDSPFQRGVERVKEYLAADSDSAACLICLGTVKPTEAIWYCEAGCYAILHLMCAQEWARNQLDAAAERSRARLQPELFPAAAAAARTAAEWGCPKCRSMYPAAAVPTSYSCFCGKTADPVWDPWLAPHTCGELCGKAVGGCGHSCMLLCHPGPCPPCPRVVDARCYCGSRVRRRRCGQHDFSCGTVCGGRLGCGHTCLQLCHPGACPPCPRMGTFSCHCGSDARSLPCSQRNFQCGRVCGRPLACGRHRCDRVCHAGDCGGCPLEGPRTCPCGKATYQDLKCDERAPTCGATCDKLLSCGRHRCTERCHHGDCTKVCRATVTKSCRCGKVAEKAMPCHQELLCDRKCTELRACGRHACKRRCCDGNCPPCEEVCGRRLRCGNHRCPAPCHSGPCRPCPLVFAVKCACGRNKVGYPCGAEQRAAPPRCSHVCPLPRRCRHGATAPAHRCHFGPCPPCRQPCGTVLPCGHTCASRTCHDPAVAPLPNFQPPLPAKNKAMQEAAAAAAATAEAPGVAVARVKEMAVNGELKAAPLLGSCPDCTVPVGVACLGRHTQQDMPCHAAKPFSCAAPCGRPLPCGNHTCSKPCHAVAVANQPSGDDLRGAGVTRLDPVPPSEPCETCTRRCSKRRACGHACPLPCHVGNCPECREPVSARCHCSKSTVRLECCTATALAAAAAGVPQPNGAGKEARVPAARAASPQDEDPLCCGKPCHKQLPRCPHPCRAVCHPGDCPDTANCSELVTVRCGCKARKERWACADVQKAIADGGSGAALPYSDATPLKLLPCDDSCAAARSEKPKGRGETGVQSPLPAQAAAAAPSAAATVARPAVGRSAADKPTLGAKRLSRAERDALAAQKERERLQQERRRRIKMRALYVLAVAVVLLLGVGGGVLALRLLRVADQKLHGMWGMEEL